MARPEHLVASIPTRDVEDFLNARAQEWDPLMASPYQIGSGYGSRIEVLLILRKRPTAEGNGNGNGVRNRRPMIPVSPVKKSS